MQTVKTYWGGETKTKQERIQLKVKLETCAGVDISRVKLCIKCSSLPVFSCFPKMMVVEVRRPTVNVYTSVSHQHTPPPQHPPFRDFFCLTVYAWVTVWLFLNGKCVCVCACVLVLVCVCNVNASQHFSVFTQLKLLLTEQRRFFIHLQALIIHLPALLSMDHPCCRHTYTHTHANTHVTNVCAHPESASVSIN